MKLTIIIPCYNEENYVGKLLQDITQQSVKPDAVFVVDCHSTDKTVKVAKSFLHKLPLKILRSPYKSAAAARNTGANEARSEYLVFLDADMRIQPSFLLLLLERAEAKQADVVTPRISIDGHHPFDHLFMLGLNIWVYLYRLTFRKQASGTAGGAMLIRRDAHNKIGGYDSQLKEFDDIDYIHRMWKHNLSGAFAWGAVAITSNRRSVEQGRFATFLQSIPDDYLIARRVVRPFMKKIGVKPKWHDLN